MQRSNFNLNGIFCQIVCQSSVGSPFSTKIEVDCYTHNFLVFHNKFVHFVFRPNYFFFTKSFFSKNSTKLVYCFSPQLSRWLFPVVSLWFYFKCYFFNQKPAKFFQFSNFPNLFNFQFWSEKTISVHLFFPSNFSKAQLMLRDCSPLPSEGFCLQSVCKVLFLLLVLTCKQLPQSSILNLLCLDSKQPAQVTLLRISLPPLTLWTNPAKCMFHTLKPSATRPPIAT